MFISDASTNHIATCHALGTSTTLTSTRWLCLLCRRIVKTPFRSPWYTTTILNMYYLLCFPILPNYCCYMYWYWPISLWLQLRAASDFAYMEDNLQSRYKISFPQEAPPATQMQHILQGTPGTQSSALQEPTLPLNTDTYTFAQPYDFFVYLKLRYPDLVSNTSHAWKIFAILPEPLQILICTYCCVTQHLQIGCHVFDQLKMLNTKQCQQINKLRSELMRDNAKLADSFVQSIGHANLLQIRKPNTSMYDCCNVFQISLFAHLHDCGMQGVQRWSYTTRSHRCLQVLITTSFNLYLITILCSPSYPSLASFQLKHRLLHRGRYITQEI